MELTREEIEHYLYQVEHNIIKLGNSTCSCILRQLLAEMDKPRIQSAWIDAPGWASRAWIQWQNESGTHMEWREKPYTRELPKSLAREISESIIQSWINEVPSGSMRISDDAMIKLINNVESAIKEALEKAK